MNSETKKITLLDRDIKLILFENEVPDHYFSENVPEISKNNAKAGVTLYEDGSFSIWFKGRPTIEVIAHEAWHLFMRQMSILDQMDHTFEELHSEIYAYTFENLISQILDKLCDMKLYKKLCEKENYKDNVMSDEGDSINDI